MIAPLIAVVGRPNVGKSTLFNRLVGGHPALVHDTPGLTRDRRYGQFEYFGRHFRLVDTGGLDPDAEKEVIGAGIHRQAYRALEEADFVLFVVDAAAGVTGLDRELAAQMHKLGRPIMVVANKVDSPKREDLVNEFFQLGLGDVFGLSAAHGRGVDDMLEALCERVPGEVVHDPEPPAVDQSHPRSRTGEVLRVALVGKPNAGKSSLLNRLVGVERSLVHHVAGTTTDPVDTEFEYAGQKFVLVDTAGIRRKAKIDDEPEKIAVSLALSQVERADVVVVVVDGEFGLSEQDARLAGIVNDSGRAVVIALNKSDLLTAAAAAETRAKASDELHFLAWAPMQLISALRGDGVDVLMERVVSVAAEHRRRVPTPELNKFFSEICEAHPPPVYGGRSVTVHYLAQGGVCPPTFLLWANRKKSVSPAYQRYLINQLRKRYGFEGTPIRIVVKEKVGRAAKPRATSPNRKRKPPRRR